MFLQDCERIPQNNKLYLLETNPETGNCRKGKKPAPCSRHREERDLSERLRKYRTMFLFYQISIPRRWLNTFPGIGSTSAKQLTETGFLFCRVSPAVPPQPKSSGKLSRRLLHVPNGRFLLGVVLRCCLSYKCFKKSVR